MGSVFINGVKLVLQQIFVNAGTVIVKVFFSHCHLYELESNLKQVIWHL